MPDFPLVPNVAGVPALFRNATNAITQPTLLLGDAPNLGSFGAQSPAPQWGIFKDGNLVVTAEQVNALDYDNESRIASFPIEGDADQSSSMKFASYDKVKNPFTMRVRFASGGSLANRQDLLNSIVTIADDLTIYDVVTPERTWPSVNLGRVSYSQRATDGVGLLKVDVEVQEIRTTGDATVTQTAQPTGAAQVAAGTQQTAPATSQQKSSVLSNILGPIN